MFGQDADHELTEAEKEIQEKQAALRRARTHHNAGRRKKVIYHIKNRKGQVETTVKTFDPNDVKMEKAIHNNEAVIVDDLSPTTSIEDAMERGDVEASNDEENVAVAKADQQPTMRADAQDVGGIVKQSEK